MLALGQRRARRPQARVRQLGGGARPDRPSRQEAVEAVQDRREVDLAGGDLELGDVGEPQLIGRVGVEVAADQVLGRLAHLADVGAVLALLLAVDDLQAVLAHDAPDHLLRHDHRLLALAQLGVHVAVAAGVLDAVEYLGDQDAQLGVLVAGGDGAALVVVAAPGQLQARQQVL